MGLQHISSEDFKIFTEVGLPHVFPPPLSTEKGGRDEVHWIAHISAVSQRENQQGNQS